MGNKKVKLTDHEKYQKQISKTFNLADTMLIRTTSDVQSDGPATRSLEFIGHLSTKEEKRLKKKLGISSKASLSLQCELKVRL